MMLGGKDDVSGSGFLEERGPFRGLPCLRAFVERLGEPIIIEILAVRLHVVPVSGRPCDAQRIQIPLGVWIVGEPSLPIYFSELSDGRRPRGHGVKAPVNKDPELGVLI